MTTTSRKRSRQKSEHHGNSPAKHHQQAEEPTWACSQTLVPKKSWMMANVMLVVVASLVATPAVEAQDTATPGVPVDVTASVHQDRFSYEMENILRPDGYMDFGLPNWNSIECNEDDELEGCVGYPDKWQMGQGWSIRRNYCQWCPAEGDSLCGRHHQSPIDLERSFGYYGHANYDECPDGHWMRYEDSSCTWNDLVQANSITVERHALRVAQPIQVLDDAADTYRLQCSFAPGTRNPRMGRLDYSYGFPEWWFLSHMDVKIPSEHTQNGKRYSGEMQLQHFYSLPEELTANREDYHLGTVSVFLEVHPDAPPYREMDRLICQWRRYEDQVRRDCRLPSVTTNYPGCFPNVRESTSKRRRRRRAKKDSATTFGTMQDLILHNMVHQAQERHASNHTKTRTTTKQPFKLQMDSSHWDGPDPSIDWDAFIQTESAKIDAYEQAYAAYAKGNHTARNRRLIAGDELDWFNYFPMLGARTEYYFRYEGTQTIPPCYGYVISGTNGWTNHWRLLKDPIRIHPRQLEEMKRLLSARIAPVDDPTPSVRCKADTAARVTNATTLTTANGRTITIPGQVSVARPLQRYHSSHYVNYCECANWNSKWPEDREYCAAFGNDNYTRLFEHPYNYDHDGF